MKQAVAFVAIASILFLAACASQSPATARHDQFPMAQGPYSVKAIAILPGGDDLAEAVGVELAKRGFVISTAASTLSIVMRARSPSEAAVEIVTRMSSRSSNPL